MNIWDILILLAVAVALLRAVLQIKKARRAGRCIGCGGCSGCSSYGGCGRCSEYSGNADSGNAETWENTCTINKKL